jgi:hypothetical protein
MKTKIAEVKGAPEVPTETVPKTEVQGFFSKSGSWRDTLGDICAWSFGFSMIGIPLINNVIFPVANAVYGTPTLFTSSIPNIDLESTLVILSGMLGVNAMKTFKR